MRLVEHTSGAISRVLFNWRLRSTITRPEIRLALDRFSNVPGATLTARRNRFPNWTWAVCGMR